MGARMELASIQAAMANLDGGMMRGQHLNNLIGPREPAGTRCAVEGQHHFLI